MLKHWLIYFFMLFLCILVDLWWNTPCAAESPELLNISPLFLLYTTHINTCHVLMTVPMYTVVIHYTIISISCRVSYSLVTVAQEKSTNLTSDVLVKDLLQDLVTVSHEQEVHEVMRQNWAWVIREQQTLPLQILIIEQHVSCTLIVSSTGSLAHASFQLLRNRLVTAL